MREGVVIPVLGSAGSQPTDSTRDGECLTQGLLWWLYLDTAHFTALQRGNGRMLLSPTAFQKDSEQK